MLSRQSLIRGISIFILLISAGISSFAASPRPDLAQGIAPGCTYRTDWPIHTVARGDTLSNLARRFNTTLAILVQSNCLPNANLIYVGQQIRVPGSGPVPTPNPGPVCQIRTDWGSYTVQRGDTAFRIARRFGISLTDLVRGNCLANANRILAGQVLRVPAAGQPIPPMTPTPYPQPELPVITWGGIPSPQACIVTRAGLEPVLIHAGANIGMGLLGQLGDYAPLNDRINGGYLVQLPGGGQGWVQATGTYLRGNCDQPTMPILGYSGANPAGVCAVGRMFGPEQVDVYSGANTGMGILGTFADWTYFSSEVGEFYAVQLPDGTIGYVQKSLSMKIGDC